MQTIAIIGAGLSGTLCLINLVKTQTEKLRIFIIDKTNKPGYGLAYCTPEPHHLLNVPAVRMSAFVNEPDHFYNWLLKHRYNYKSSDFVPRFLYGSYIHELYLEAVTRQSKNLEVHYLPNEAIDIELFQRKAFIHLDDNNLVMSDKVILALGNFPAAHLELPDMSYIRSKRYIQHPWNDGILNKIASNDDIMIIGTGLTMVDIVASLHHKGHRGSITAVSKNGFLPKLHDRADIDSTPDYLAVIPRPTDLNQIFSYMKPYLKQDNWLEAVNNILLHFKEIWSELSVQDKQRFSRHLHSRWSAARHRMPAQVGKIISSMVESGQLKVVSALLQNIQSAENCLEATVYLRKVQETIELCPKFIINCTGQESNYEKLNNKLVQKLVKNGLLRNDPMNLGVNATAEGALIDASGRVSNILFTLGPPLKGVLGEASSVPEIRQQAQRLANILTSQTSRIAHAY
jgi:uncharacterized NAD(P)/FAD-binding protein YdhS